MLLNEVEKIMVGNSSVEAAYVGDTPVWIKNVYLEITPDMLWLIDENDIQVVDVTSNTQWFVE